jgi:hypothetical protein
MSGRDTMGSNSFLSVTFFIILTFESMLVSYIFKNNEINKNEKEKKSKAKNQV